MQKNQYDNKKKKVYLTKGSKKIAALISYIFLGFSWFLVSSLLLKYIPVRFKLNDSDIYLQGGTFVIISAGILFYSTSKLKKYLSLSVSRLEQSNTNLIKVRERLSIQLDELNVAEKALRTSEERYRLAAEASKDGIWDIDLITNKIVLSPKLQELIEVDVSTLEGFIKHWVNIIHPEDKQLFINNYKDCLEGKQESLNLELRVITTKDEFLWMSVVGKTIKNAQGKTIRITGSLSDISERKHFEKKMFNLAYYDQITSLPNRSYLFESLSQMLKKQIAEDNNFVIIFIDLDDLKGINDTLGHDFGDLLLKEFSIHLSKYFADSMCFRFSGDEFIVIKSIDSCKDNISKLCNEAVNALGKFWSINNHEFFLSVSIGVSIFPIHGISPQELIRNADLAMRSSKNKGKNSYCIYNPSMSSRLFLRMQVEKELMEAIKEDELIIFYQPLINGVTEKIVSAEALVRWNHPKKGIISPAEFIPIAEESGLIIKLGEMIIEKSIKQLHYWKSKGLKVIPISINLSPMQFQQANLIQFIDTTLKVHNVEPSLIKFEITESTALKDITQTIKTINIFKSMNIEVALDDFGTGYSSLTYLKQLPINYLKMDKAFIQDIDNDIQEASIVLNIITLAHDLSLKVVAEGVENQRQATILKDYGCDELQGYHYGKPMLPHQLEEILTTIT